MFKNYITGCFFVGVVLFSFFGFQTDVFAQTSAGQAINAEILSDIWYSTTDISEGDKIMIYVGFQNHSDKNLAGTAGFYVDGLEIAKSDFTANLKSLIKLEAPYIAKAGNHKVQIKILSIKEPLGNAEAILSINNLLSSETAEKDLNVKRPITREVVLTTAGNIANTVVNTVNKYADKLADYVESQKKPTEQSNLTSDLITTSSQDKFFQKDTFGTSTINAVSANDKNKFSFYNFFMDILIFLIGHWVWVVVAIFLFIVYSIFRRD